MTALDYAKCVSVQDSFGDDRDDPKRCEDSRLSPVFQYQSGVVNTYLSTREGLNYSPLVMRYEEGCTEREARPMQQQTFADPSFEQ